MRGSSLESDRRTFDRKAVAEELRGLTGLTEGSGRLVRELASALDDGDVARLEQWAELDLLSVFARGENLAKPVPRTGGGPPSRHSYLRPQLGSTAGSRAWELLDLAWARLAAVREQGWERAAEAVLGVLVFVPLLVTWTGLALAASAYGRLASGDAPQSTRPFLQLWESGFDGRLPGWARFGDIAVTAVVFISMLLLLSAAHSLARHRAQSTAEREDDERELRLGRLVAVVSRAQFVVGGYRIDSPTRLSDALSGRAGELTQLLEGARTAHQSAETVIGRVGDLVASLQGVTDRVVDAAEKIRQVQEKGVEAVDKAVNSSAQRLLEAHEKAAVAGRDATVRAMASVEQTLASLLQLQEQATATSKSEAEQSQKIVREGVEALRSTQDAALDSLRQARESLTFATAQGADAVGSVGAALRSTGDRIDAALRALADAQGELGRRSGEAVAATEQSAVSMQGMTQAMARAISELRHSVERWDAAAAHWENAAEAVERGTRIRYGGPGAPAGYRPASGQAGQGPSADGRGPAPGPGERQP
jgi:ABC-type transporter Mla subunit MlaD